MSKFRAPMELVHQEHRLTVSGCPSRGAAGQCQAFRAVCQMDLKMAAHRPVDSVADCNSSVHLKCRPVRSVDLQPVAHRMVNSVADCNLSVRLKRRPVGSENLKLVAHRGGGLVGGLSFRRPIGAPTGGVRLSFHGGGWTRSGVLDGAPNGFKMGGV